MVDDRDQFAMAALPGLLASIGLYDEDRDKLDGWKTAEVACVAYDIADSMVAMRGMNEKDRYAYLTKWMNEK